MSGLRDCPVAAEYQRPSVLLIDDDAESLAQMATALRWAGWEPVLARDGADALELFARRAFDLVITEIILDGKEGIELIMDMKAQRPSSPILAISGGGLLPAGQVLRLAESLGANASLGKPLCIDVMLTVAASLAQGAAPAPKG